MRNRGKIDEYVEIEMNLYGDHKISFEDEVADCNCSHKNPCNVDCMNWKLYLECDEDCPAKDRCGNKRIQNGQTMKTEVKSAGTKGVSWSFCRRKYSNQLLHYRIQRFNYQCSGAK